MAQSLPRKMIGKVFRTSEGRSAEATVECGTLPGVAQVQDDLKPCLEYRKKLERDTGFKTYKDYLDHNLSGWPHHRILSSMLELGEWRANYDHKGQCFLFNAHDSGHLSNPVRYDGIIDQTCCAEVMRGLQNPPQDTVALVLVVELLRGQELPPWLVDAIGLSLRLDPRFFEAFSLRMTVDGMNSAFGKDGRSEALPTFMRTDPGIINVLTEPRPKEPRHLAVGPYVATIANVKTENDRNLPVAVVFGSARKDVRHRWDLGMDASPPPPFLEETGSELTACAEWLDMIAIHYQRLFRTYAGSWSKLQECPIRLMFPLLEINLLYLHSVCRVGRSKYLRLNIREEYPTISNTFLDTNSLLYDEWFRLRRFLEDFLDSEAAFIRMVGTQEAGGCLSDDIYKRIKSESVLMAADARRLEAEIREYMQYQVGNATLAESKRSIETSKIQLQEARRARILTAMAFIYVPVTLCTSIFGMNLPEVSGEGLSIWNFVVTAAVLLLLTLFSWASVLQWSEFRDWQVRRASLSPTSRTASWDHFCILIRLYMLVYLLKHEHVAWAWSTNAWIGLLTHDKLGGFFIWHRYEHVHYRSACQYLNKYLDNEKSEPFEMPFTTGPEDLKG